MLRKSLILFALLLGFAVPVAGSTKTWTGAGGNDVWSNPANWDGGVAPADGDDLVFNAASTTNDLVGLSLHSIRITTGVPTLSGNAISLAEGGIAANSKGMTLSLDVTLTASQSWIFEGPYSCLPNVVTLNGAITGDGDLVLVEGYVYVQFYLNGHINNHGDLELRGGWYAMNNENAFTGTLAITSTAESSWCWPGERTIAVYVKTVGAIPAGAPLVFSSPTVVTWGGTHRTFGVSPKIFSPTEALLDLGGQTISVASLSGLGTIQNGTINRTSPQDTSIAVKLLTMTLNMTAGRQTITGNNQIDHLYSAGQSVTVNVSGGTVNLALAAFGASSVLNVSDGTVEITAPPLLPCYLFCSLPSSVTDLNLSAAARFKVNLSTTAPSPTYLTAFNISLGNSTLELVPPGGPHDSTQVLIKNATGKPVNGTFAGLPEGAVILVGEEYYRITYRGGGSNSDVVITAIPRAATTTTLAALPNPSLFGDSIVLAATVSSTAGTPTGTVAFYDGSSSLGKSTLTPYGQATLTLGSLGAGSHSLTAAYAGNPSMLPSTSAAVEEAVKYATHTSLTTSANPSTPGQLVTFTANVRSDKGVPPGNVTFFDAWTMLGRSPLDGSGNATLSTCTLSEGAHPIFARYDGSATHDRSAGAFLTQMVGASPHVTLTATPNPAMAGQPVLLTAIVTSPTSEVMVTFSDGSTVLGTVTIDSDGCAVLQATLEAGTHNLTAMYGTAIATTSIEVSPARRRGTHH